MAQGYLQLFAGEKAKVYSAGIEAHGLNQRAVKVMQEDGIDEMNVEPPNRCQISDIGYFFPFRNCHM